MKKVLVLACLLVFGLGSVVFAGAVTGDLSTYLVLDPGTSTEISAFGATFEIDYTVGGWVFGSTAIFNLTAFDNLFFDAKGSLGAFTFNSVLDFEPQSPSRFVFWGAGASLAIAGVDLYAVTSIYNFSTVAVPDIGVGWQVGGSGVAGDVTVTGNVRFNMPDRAYYIWAYGYDWFLGKMAYTSCGSWVKPYSGWVVQTHSCTAAFSGADIFIEFPFACLDMMLNVSFSCENGFDGFFFELYDIDLGLSWLTIPEIDINFAFDDETNSLGKEVCLFFDLVLADTICIVPYIQLEGTVPSIDGITLNALLLSYTWNGVTFKAGEIFDNTWTGGNNCYYGPNAYTWGFNSTGGLNLHSYYPACTIDIDYDEYFGFEIDGDSCCGGAFSVYMYSWFDTGDGTGIFDWEETTAGVEFGIGPNTTLGIDLSLMNDGLDWIKLGVDFTF